MEHDNIEPDPLAFVQDRITILRAAHTLLREFDLPNDVDDLLSIADWLAVPVGEDVPQRGGGVSITFYDEIGGEEETEDES